MSQFISYIKIILTSIEENMAAAALAAGNVQDGALMILPGHKK